MKIEYARAASTTECDDYSAVVARAFAWDPEMARGWVRDWGHDCVRVLRVDGTLVGGLQLIPLGVYFGGRSVGLTGVGAVVLLPEHRGKGAGKVLMREAMLEAMSSDRPLAGLFPATLPVYRSAGFEQAGARVETALTLNQIRPRRECVAAWNDKDLRLEAIANSEEIRARAPDAHSVHASIRDLYARVAPAFDGHLDRPANVWRTQVYALKREPTHGYAIRRLSTGRVEGYFFYHQTRGDSGIELLVRDAVCETPAAWARFLGFLADHWSTSDRAVWMVPAQHPALSMLSEDYFKSSHAVSWMLRVMNVRRALEDRGFAPSLRTSFALRVSDDLFPENQGTWRVAIEAGRARVSRGDDAEPAVALDVRTLAPIFSGWQTPRALRAAGLVACADDAMLDNVAAAFANAHGSTPWLSEIY